MKLKINNIEVNANVGDNLLQVARENNIFIPAICYMAKCSPTMACRLCMVEVDGKRVFSCATKIKEDMKEVVTSTEEIQAERLAIMQSYCVNHPLECGVCDKSGECELQDYTLLMGVQSQKYAIKESFKEFKSWARVSYDPNLCIMCERCVTTCKENLGEANLKALKNDELEVLDSAKWKDIMPKDALNVWGRKQKAMIGFVGESPCYDCAECVSACPVGALGTKDFQYKINAWETTKTPSTCLHCPLGCQITYESGKVSIQSKSGENKIYRVSNDYLYSPICSAGRFGYHVSSQSNPNNNLENAINAFKNATHINIGSDTSNEEAYILNLIAKDLGLDIVNDSIYAFKEFLSVILESSTQKTIPTLDEILNANNIITLGFDFKYAMPALRYKINNKLKASKDSALFYLFPIEDKLITSLSKNVTYISYNPANLSDIAENIAKFVGDDEASSKLMSSLQNSEQTSVLLLGEDCFKDVNALYIAKILGEMAKNHPHIKLAILPSGANDLGIILNSDIKATSSQNTSGKSIGFRAWGDYVLDSDMIVESTPTKKVHFTLPSHTQMQGSVTSAFGRVLPLDNALNFNAYELSDIARKLGVCEYEYLQEALKDIKNNPKKISKLANSYGINGSDNRGFEIQSITIESNSTKIEKTPTKSIEFNAIVRDTQSQFDAYTYANPYFQSKVGIYVNTEFATKLGLKLGSKIVLKDTQSLEEISSRLYIDDDILGDIIAISPSIFKQRPKSNYLKMEIK